MRSITSIKVTCQKCHWEGTVGDCESGEDGCLACPKCGTLDVKQYMTPKELELTSFKFTRGGYLYKTDDGGATYTVERINATFKEVMKYILIGIIEIIWVLGLMSVIGYLGRFFKWW